MSEINFAKTTQSYERFYNIAHIAAGVVTILMAIFAIFTKNGYIYFPAIFLVAGLIELLNAYDALKGVRKNAKRKRAGVIMLVMAGLLFLLTAISIICFWI